MGDKPLNPYPFVFRRILRKTLPFPFYQKYFGRHENGSLALWTYLSKKMNKDGAVLDIGSFHGEYALATRRANPYVSIYAFEPNPENVAILLSNIEGKNIFLEQAAVSDFDGDVLFSVDAATSRIMDTDISSGLLNVVKACAICLDTWVQERQVFPSLVKIDVEGFETEVLRGARNTLQNCQPLILCEILSDVAGKQVMPLFSDDYLFYHIDENKGIKRQSNINRKKWRNHNWLFVPKSKVSTLEEFQLWER